MGEPLAAAGGVERSGRQRRCNALEAPTSFPPGFPVYMYADLLDERDVELLQNMSCKVDAGSLRPAEYAANPEMEWCARLPAALQARCVCSLQPRGGWRLPPAPVQQGAGERPPPRPHPRLRLLPQQPSAEGAALPRPARLASPRHRRCPPGHGDIYPSLLGSGMLDRLIEGAAGQGRRRGAGTEAGGRGEVGCT